MFVYMNAEHHSDESPDEINSDIVVIIACWERKEHSLLFRLNTDILLLCYSQYLVFEVIVFNLKMNFTA